MLAIKWILYHLESFFFPHCLSAEWKFYYSFQWWIGCPRCPHELKHCEKQWTKKQKQMSNSTSEPEVTHRTCHGIVSFENMGTRKEVSNSMQQWVRVLFGFCPAWVCCCRRSYRINLIISSDAWQKRRNRSNDAETLAVEKREKSVSDRDGEKEMRELRCKNVALIVKRWQNEMCA